MRKIFALIVFMLVVSSAQGVDRIINGKASGKFSIDAILPGSRPAIVTTSRVAYWQFDESLPNSTINDYYAVNNGTDTGTRVPGVINNCGSWNESGGSQKGIVKKPVSGGDFTIQFWFYMAAIPNWYVSYFINLNDGDCYICADRDSKHLQFGNDAEVCNSTQHWSTGTWTNLAITYDVDLKKKDMFINGVWEQGLVGVGTMDYGTQWGFALPPTAGVDGKLFGRIDEVQVYSIQLTTAQVSQNYEAQKP